eukprot:GDKI01008723.1.p1 GENE.GDKI01008723.1~~GDKI01008723.1.p1  ORF type:complete len:451 (+),score=139.43 GDKI01008723.1:221-1573(+)
MDISWLKEHAGLKAYYFIAFMAAASGGRLMTLYYQAQGITPLQIGAMESASRMCGIFCAPLWALLADRTQRPKALQLSSSILRLLLTLTLYVPLALPLPLGGRFGAVLVCSVLGSAVKCSLGDPLVLKVLGKERGKFGQQRLWGAMSFGLMHFVVGVVLEWYGFTAMFVAIAATGMLDVATQWMVFPDDEPVTDTQRNETQDKKPTQPPPTLLDMLKLLASHPAFFIACLCVSIGLSLVDSLLLVMLRGMGASNALCGTAVALTVLFEMPVMFYANTLIKEWGVAKMILFGHGAYVIRVILYTLIPSPEWVLLVEPLHGLTFAMVWCAAVHYCGDKKVCPPNMASSSQGLLSTLFTRIGPVMGKLGGGWVMQNYGPIVVYRGAACLLMLSAMAYFTHVYRSGQLQVTATEEEGKETETAFKSETKTSRRGSLEMPVVRRRPSLNQAAKSN